MTLSSSAGTVTFNDLDHGAGLGLPADNGYLVQSVIGNEQPGLRTPNENRPHKGGGMIHPFFRATKLIVVEGLVVATKPWCRSVMQDHLQAVTDPLLKNDGTFTWALPPKPYSTTRFHTVRLYAGVEFRGQVDSQHGMSAAPKLFHIEMIAYKLGDDEGENW